MHYPGQIEVEVEEVNLEPGFLFPVEKNVRKREKIYLIISAIINAMIINASANPLSHKLKVRAFDFFCAIAVHIFMTDTPPNKAMIT